MNKKIIILIITLLIIIIPNKIKAYELETESGYEYSKTLPESGYSYHHTECNGTKVKEENVTYNEEAKTFNINGITEQNNCKFYFNKNGEEIIRTYEVQVTVLNGTIEGETRKVVRSNANATFTLNPTNGYSNPTVTCTNNQTGSVTNNTLTVSNVTNDTVCTVEFKELNAANIIISKYTENNTDGLIRLDQPATEQTPALTEYRYSGSNNDVKNYVTFNNETWRIIGVFDDKLKLITDDPIPTVFKDNGLTVGGYAIYAPPSVGGTSSVETKVDFFYWNYNGTNNWEDATLNKYLNGTYYDNINSDSKELIVKEKWYLGGIGEKTSNTTAREYYEFERGNSVYSSNPIFTISYIGLVYPSDIYYASSPLPTNFPDYVISTRSNWLVTSLWTITASSKNGDMAYTTLDVINSYTVNEANSTFAKYEKPLVYPTLYLKEEAKIISGNGTMSNPYQLSL